METYLKETRIGILKLNKKGGNKGVISFDMDAKFNENGIGEKVLEELLQWVLNTTSMIELEVLIYPNERVEQRLFQSFGFSRIGTSLVKQKSALVYVKKLR